VSHPLSSSVGPAALIVAHPGHELRVHGWIETARPVTFVLTEGDGYSGVSRLASTTKVLRTAGARTGSIYGRFTDPQIYAALLRRDHGVFLRLLDELVEAMISLGITYAAADAEEGYNPAHDVCHHLAVAATAMTARMTGRAVRAFDFPVVGAPDACPDDLRSSSIWLELDDDALARKLSSARSYPGLEIEVSRAVGANGAAAFRMECLRPAVVRNAPLNIPPFYEQYGERQVAAGRYAETLRYARHVMPLKQALCAHADVEG
jgi:hypothetical protein